MVVFSLVFPGVGVHTNDDTVAVIDDGLTAAANTVTFFTFSVV